MAYNFFVSTMAHPMYILPQVRQMDFWMLSGQYSTIFSKDAASVSAQLGFLMELYSYKLWWSQAKLSLMGPIYKFSIKSVSHFKTKTSVPHVYFATLLFFYTSDMIISVFMSGLSLRGIGTFESIHVKVYLK